MSKQKMNAQQKKETFTIGAGTALLNVLEKGINHHVCTAKEEFGLDLFFPARSTGRAIRLTGAAHEAQCDPKTKQDAVIRVGSVSLRVDDGNGNRARLAFDTLKPVIIGSDTPANVWWSSALIECTDPAAAAAFEERLQLQAECPAIRLSTVYEMADNGYPGAKESLDAIKDFTVPVRGLNLLKKPERVRYDLAKMICILDPSGGPNNAFQFWTHEFKPKDAGGMRPAAASMNREFGQNT